MVAHHGRRVIVAVAHEPAGFLWPGVEPQPGVEAARDRVVCHWVHALDGFSRVHASWPGMCGSLRASS